ncbi:ABC transporter ATP-binding protein [Vibrio cholerae]|uniref:ABC transporter ATP-binding protein n=2 Tax=Vibrio cholerae TaxID=666 RepID=UPI001966B5CB|nr:ABC transporter ATP-binding protein [Vibrio cholerae]EJL6471135.1 ABC transporter ATP-binding protein [Vibrio cholerae]EJL6553088.1 ABC transporter ATP-binding protein [Vibrio cholerae]EJL6717324.1 ABC transporter ATP-binding protein [Vibrio cholerae]EKF9635512.1 ABC transporter ATP-binding protein [Vibrio cholerae]ELJ8526963.1 ABC transporter ATP-binding protein [Vibrio cholerae]
MIQKKIIMDNVTVSYPIFNASQLSLKSTLFNRGKDKEYYFNALEEINLTIQEGDRICLVGHNGAGKSTLLKTIAGILHPTKGELVVDGAVSPLLDFATGFEMEMTGFENIYIRGLLLGMSKDEILEKRREIIEFSELGEFIYQPVKTYSSGMFIKLAFSIVTSINPELLVIDEIVGAGDASFAKKAQARMLDMLSRGNTVVMATHSTELAKELCDKAIWLNKGQLVKFGSVSDVIDEYLESAKYGKS